MKIIQLEAENVKRLKAVSIKPNGNMVEITGRNGQGKTSVLDSIWWALDGAGHIQTVPIRKGAEQARIRLDLGELKVTRTFKRKDDDTYSTSIVVENGDGARFSSPQKMLDALMGSLTFDPLAFTRLDAKGQFNELRRFVPDIDFDMIAGDHKADYDNRTAINRQAKEARAAADRISVPDDLPDAPIDEAGLVAELEMAGQHNAAIQTQKDRHAYTKLDIERHKADALSCRKQADALIREAESHEAAADGLLDHLANGAVISDPIDTTSIRAKIGSARQVNGYLAEKDRKDGFFATALRLEKQAAELTKKMETRQESKAASIREAKMPVEGLTLGDDEVLLNGVPLNQASDAEQLRASISIAMATNPKLRVIRVRDGSLLDEQAMKILASLADEKDYQVWIERVESSGKIGFVIEDGTLKDDDAAAKAA